MSGCLEHREAGGGKLLEESLERRQTRPGPMREVCIVPKN